MTNKRKKHLPLCQLTPLAVTMLLIFSGNARAELYFDPALLSGDIDNIADLSSLQNSGQQLPGVYQVDIFLNGSSVKTDAVSFISKQQLDANNVIGTRDGTGLMACLSVEDLKELGVNVALMGDVNLLAQEQCIAPGRYLHDAYTDFNFQQMRLDIGIPQAALKARPRGWISPEQWNEGINAAQVGYRLNGSENSMPSGHSRNLFLNLNNGINIGPWRLRDNRNWTSYSSSYGTQTQWHRINTYAERAIIPWSSRLTLGESNSGSEIFDAFSFRGVQLATDESMYPDTMRGFAPTVKGVAASNARVSIRQGGNEIYQTFVPPGAFVIDDLYPLSMGGDLDVTVTESDGSERTFTIPYSSVPVLQREGSKQYRLTAGNLRSGGDNYHEPSFVSGTLLWGLPYDITAYGGGQYAEKYNAQALGLGVNLGRWGAFSADVTNANSVLADDSHHNGQSIRLQFARSLDGWGTTFQLAGYRYSTQGFYTLEESAMKQMSGWLNEDGMDGSNSRGEYYNLNNARRTKVSANISQRVSDNSSVYLTGSRQTWWNKERPSDSLQLGYSGQLGPANYTLSWGYSKTHDQQRTDKLGFLTLSLPLDKLLPFGNERNTTWATYSANRDGDGRIAHTAGVGGTALSENNLNWNLNQGYSARHQNMGSASLNYRGAYGSSQLGYSYGDGYKQVNYGIAGGAILHRNGLTLGQQPGETNVLVAAPGASGVPVEGGTGIRTDWRGYAIVPYSTAYRNNRVSLNTRNINSNTEIETSTVQVVPTRGSLVRAEFKTRRGERVLMTLTYRGKALPFGTMVTGQNISGIVGDEGQVYLSGMPERGELSAQWGNEDDQSCTVNFLLPQPQLENSIIHHKESCK